MVQKNKILSGVLGVVFIVFLFLGKSFSQTHPPSGVLFQNTSNGFFIPEIEPAIFGKTKDNKLYSNHLKTNPTKKEKQTTANQHVLSSSIFAFSLSNDTKNQLIASAVPENLNVVSNNLGTRISPHTHNGTLTASTAATITSTSTETGNWSDASSWIGRNVPQLDDDVIIAAGTTIIINTDVICQSITIENTGSLIISGTNALKVSGDWTNDGTFDAGTSGIVEFSGSTPTTISGTTVFEELVVTKGDLTNSVIIEGNVTVSSGGSLTLNRGLIQVSSGAGLSLDNNNQLDIPETGGLEVNGGNLTTGNFSIVNEGLIRINSGTVNFGTDSGNSVHTQQNGAFHVIDGIVNIAGRLENTAGGTLPVLGIQSGIDMQGGTITLATVGNGLSNNGSLSVSKTGYFNFEAGTIIFQTASSAKTAIDFGLDSEYGQGTKTITNGVFQFGNSSTTSNSTFVIDSEIPIPNIVTNNGIDLFLVSPLVITDQLNLGTDSRIELNGNSIQLAVSPNGTYDFPLTDGGNSIPLKVQITGGNEVGDATLSVSTFGTKHPENANTNNFLNRNWTIDITGITNLSYDVLATYAPTIDITGTESAIAMGTYNGSLPWVKFADANTTAHTISATGLTDTSIGFSGITSDPPTVSVSATDETICSGNSTTLTATASGDPTLTYSWTSTPTGFTSTNPAINVSPTSNTTYEVTVTDGNGFTATDNIDITVNSLPTASITGTSPICTDDNSILTSNATAGSGSISSYQWYLNGSSISGATGSTYSASTAGDYTVTVTNNNGCSITSAPFSLIIDALPTASITGNSPICADENSTLTSNATAGSGSISSYQWNLNGSSISGATGSTYSASTAGDYTVTVTNNNGCSITSAPFSLTVNPTPTAVNPGDQTYCLGESTSEVVLNGTPSNVVFDVTGGASIGLNDQTNVNKIPSFIAREGSATLLITPKANGCTGTSISVGVDVFPLPNIQTPTSSQTICSGETTNISLSSTTPGTTFSWVVVDAGTVTGASDGTGNLISQTLENKTTSISYVTYQITADANGCEGATRNFTVTVHPEVTAAISGGDTFCQNDVQPDITFTANGGTPPYTFTYNINGGVSQKAVANSGNSVTVSVPTDVAGTFNYNLVSATGSTGCPYAQFTSETIIIKPQPSLTSSLTPPGICSNTPFNYTPTSDVTGTLFNWTRDAIPGISNPASSGINDPDEILYNTTTVPIDVVYHYTLTANGCTNTQDVIVTVTQTPHLTSTLSPPNICSGTIFSYTPTSAISGTNFEWTRAAVNGISNPAASGSGNPNEILINTSENPIGVTYVYTLNSNNCPNPDTYSVIVTVIPSPEATASVSSTEICPGESVNLFSSANITSSLQNSLLEENFNGGSTPSGWTTTNNSYNGSPNEAAWRLHNSPYYYSGYDDVTFRSNDNSRFYLSNSDAQWGGTTNTTLQTPSMNTVGYNSLELSFWHYYRDYGNNSGDYAYVEASTNGTDWHRIHRYNSTNGSSTNFSHQTFNLSGYINQPTLYIRFRYQASWDWFWAIDNVSITGEAQNQANISWASNTSSWTSSEANPTNVSPTETTTYTVTYTDPETGCDGSASTTVTVYPKPDATIQANYCVNAPKIRLTTGEFVDYDWQPLPYGETNGKQYIDIDIAGIYTVTVTDANGCTGTASIDVSNEYVTNGSFTQGNDNFYTDYGYRADNPSANNELSTGGPGGGGEGLYGVGVDAHNYHSNFWGRDHTTGSGTGDSQFLIVNGRGNTYTIWEQEVIGLDQNTNYYFSAWAISLNNVGPFASLRFEIETSEYTIQLGSTANLSAGTNSNSNPWKPEDRFYGQWNSGNATSAILRIVNLEPALGGNDFGIDDISFGILDPSPAEIVSLDDIEVCSGETIKLQANIGGGKEPITYLWEFPNGESSTDESPEIPNADITYDGIYTLTINDWYGCEIPSETMNVIVHPQTTVDAGPDQAAGCSANNAFILNGTIGGSASSATWTTSNGTGVFDDPNSLSTTYHASNADIIAGTVTLILTTDDPVGPCSRVSDDLIVTIHPSPEITLEINHPPCYGENTGSATANVTNGTAPFDYLWSDGQTTPTATDLTVGTYTITVTDANNCSDTKTFDIIEPEPLVSYPASFTPPTCYGGNDGTATINASGGTQPYIYEWGDKANNQTTQTATNLSVGTYTFTVTDVNGCNMTTDFVLVTQPNPEDLACPPNPAPVQAAPGESTAEVTLDDPTYSVTCQNISWTMSGATIVSTPVDGIVPSPYTFNAGTTTVHYTTVNVAGDELTCSFDVVVIPNDPPAISCADPENINATPDQCSADLSIGFPTITQGEDISWQWQMTDSDDVVIASGTGAIPDPYTFNVGETTIRWVATNTSGTATCDQLITVLDNQPPALIAPTPFEECVESLFQAVYNSSTTDINPDRPEYYLFEAGSTELDLDATNFTGNCDLNCDIKIRWRIDFSDGSTLPELPDTYITGQPSTYGSDIPFPGDGVTFTSLVHTITYWIVDCNNNVSAPATTTFTVKPRPNITKMN